MNKKFAWAKLVKQILFSWPLALTITGCSSVTYVEPKSGPVARVRFVSDTGAITIVRSYSSTSCDGEKEMMRLRNGFLVNSEPRRLGIPLWNYHEDAAKEFLVSSNNPQIYMFDGGENYALHSVNCGVAIKQKFKEGRDYELNYKFNGGRCHVEVSEIKNNGSGSAEKTVLQKRSSRLNSEFSESCLSEFKKLRIW